MPAISFSFLILPLVEIRKDQVRLHLQASQRPLEICIDGRQLLHLV